MIQRILIHDFRMTPDKMFQHGTGTIQFGIEKAGKLVIDFYFQIPIFPLNGHDIV